MSPVGDMIRKFPFSSSYRTLPEGRWVGNAARSAAVRARSVCGMAIPPSPRALRGRIVGPGGEHPDRVRVARAQLGGGEDEVLAAGERPGGIDGAPLLLEERARDLCGPVLSLQRVSLLRRQVALRGAEALQAAHQRGALRH